MSFEYNKLKSDTYKKLAEKHGRRPTVGKFLTELNKPFGAVDATVEWRNASFNVQLSSDDAWFYHSSSENIFCYRKKIACLRTRLRFFFIYTFGNKAIGISVVVSFKGVPIS